MKVFIGPYPSHLSTQGMDRLWYKLRYGKCDWEVENPDRFDRAYESFSTVCSKLICRPFNEFFSTRKRLIKIHIDDYDVWGADHTLALIIAPLLKKLAEKKHGSPVTDDADAPEHLRSTAAPPIAHEGDVDENFHKRWNWILSEMIWAFEQLASEDSPEDAYISGESDTLLQGIDKDDSDVGEPFRLGDDTPENDKIRAYRLLKGPNHTRTVDEEGLKAHRARVANGVRLFGKYYRDLWD
jgi:hypothetical protein